MKMRRMTFGLLMGSLVSLGDPLAAAVRSGAATAVLRELPRVTGPIPVTATSRPFLGAQAVLDPAGYGEDEYFLSGNANTYDWTGQGHKVKVIAGPGKYVTRILVMRPRDPTKFGGNVEVTVFNASLNMDFGGPTDFDTMVKQGDVWIGITSKAVNVKALKNLTLLAMPRSTGAIPRPRTSGALCRP